VSKIAVPNLIHDLEYGNVENYKTDFYEQNNEPSGFVKGMNLLVTRAIIRHQTAVLRKLENYKRNSVTTLKIKYVCFQQR
jgi:hypothetical protein